MDRHDWLLAAGFLGIVALALYLGHGGS